MSAYAIIFYLLGALSLGVTAMALCSRVLMHAALYMVVAFATLAALFLLLGAPLLAVFQVMVYAGAIMVLFLFVIMYLDRHGQGQGLPTNVWRWAGAGILALLALVGMVALTSMDASPPLELAQAAPRDFGALVMGRYWLAVEAVSLLLFAALAGAYLLGRPLAAQPPKEDRP